MAVFLGNLAMASYFLALCYTLATVATFNRFRSIRRFLRRHDRTGWSTTQLLILSVALGSLFRAVTFSTLCLFDSLQLSSVNGAAAANGPVGAAMGGLGGIGVLGGGGWLERANGVALDPIMDQWTPSPQVVPGGANAHHNTAQQLDLNFYNKVVAVLFNLPDYLLVSSYLLLVLIFAEAFLSSRHHWFSAETFRKRWMIFYLVFNAALYMTQLVLYFCLFLRDDKGLFDDEDSQKRLIPIAETLFDLVAAVDLFLPMILFCTWCYLTVTLSGFPFRSSAARRRLQKLEKVTLIWSAGRILYSICTLLTFTKGWFHVERANAPAQSMLLVAVFVFSELLPIYWILDSRLLAMLSVDDYHPLTPTLEG